MSRIEKGIFGACERSPKTFFFHEQFLHRITS
jgi:hypothetical protein